MTKMYPILLLAALACLLPVVTMAQYPAIAANEGFDVDMEPFWVEQDWEETNPMPLDVQGFFRQEMKVVLPNIIGVILQKYNDTTLQSKTASRAFYTGVVVFKGPPFRTNNAVYKAQVSAMTSLMAANTYLHVHNASLGIPEWFDDTTAGEANVKMPEETDGATINPNIISASTNGQPFTVEGVALGIAVGFVVGVCFTMAMLFSRSGRPMVDMTNMEPPASPHGTPRRTTPRHKRKSSNGDFSIDNMNQHPHDIEQGSTHDMDDEFLDEEEQVHPLTHSPAKENLSQDMTPRKRKNSHHRRWKSGAFHDMASPSSVMDTLGGLIKPNSTPPSASHRRAHSMADAPSTGGHRRNKSMADAFKPSRRESMQDLLAEIDMQELMNETENSDD